jgi:SMI1 / KNR4 family (SUKH-1)
MSPSDLDRIETELGIQLPPAYRRLMGPFPIPYLRRNDTRGLWDNADELIKRNLELRNDSHEPWPAHWVLIGEDGSAANAIDLRDPAAAVSWVDHWSLKTVQGRPGTPFENWLSKWRGDEISDLLGDGIDPNAEPPPPSATSTGCFRSIGMLLLIGIIASIVITLLIFLAW